MSSHSILMYASPADTEIGLAALAKVKAILSIEQQINQVFFYGPAVTYASCHLEFPSGLIDLQKQWLELSAQYGFPLVVCATAASQYGLRAELPPEGTLQRGFSAAGLTEFMTQLHTSAELQQF